ncbi:MAG: hypothetical protein QOC96_1801 [Acidobacteriota bacterium]|jgi:hypothetical protein|nr:hypothetical protein [Acidobacteriota bacterium]
MMKELYLAVDHPGTFIQKLLEPLAASATAETRSPRKHFAPHLFAILLAALICVASGQAQSFAPTRLRHLATLRASDLPDGSRVTIASDSALDDYRTYRDADRFHILIPQAEFSTAINALHGRGFTAIQSERRGPDLDLSFVLQPGVTASVTQKFNRLDVTFNLPSNAAASVANIATDAASSQFPASEPAPSSVALAQGERVSLPAMPSATPDSSPSSSSSKKDKKPSKANAPDAGQPAIVLPPEKANAVRIPRFDKPPVIDGKLDDAVWQQAVVLKDFYQVKPGDNTLPSKPTEVLIGYDAKFIYFGFHCYDEPDKVRATVAKRDDIFNDDFVGFYMDTFNDHRKAYEAFFNPLGVQADGIVTEGNGEDFSVDWVMESKGVITKDGYTVEVAIPFKSLRYEAGKGKLWGVHFLRRTQRLNSELDSWMPLSRSNSSTLNQAGHLTGLEGISTERTLELIPSLTISETGKRVSSFVPPPNGATDPGRMVNQPVKFDPGLTAKFGLTPTVTLDLALNPDFAQVEADQTVVTANQRFPIFFPEKRPFFLEGIDIFQTPLTVVHTRAIVNPEVAVKLSGKLGRNTFGLMAASDKGPGNFIGDERLDLNNAPFLDKKAYIGVLRLKHDLGTGEDTIGMIATTYNFIQKHGDVLGFDGRFRLDKQSVLTFQVAGTTSRRFFFEPDQGQNIFRTGNAFAYNFHYEVDGRNFGWNYDAHGFTKDYRADVGFTTRTNNNRHGLFVYYQTDPKPKATLINVRVHDLPEIQFDWQGRLQSWGHETQVDFRLKHQTDFGVGVSFNYERLFEREFGATRQAPSRQCFSANQLLADPSLHCGFAGNNSERSTHRNNIYAYGDTTLSKKYALHFFTIRNWGAFDFDFGAGPRFPRVSPLALIHPDAAPLDPGTGDEWHFEGSALYQPTNTLRLSLDYTKDRLVRGDTGRVAFDENIFSLHSTYQFTRFTFARARIDYDTIAANVRAQFLLGWAPNPGTSFYAGYNDDLNLNGYGPVSGLLEPGFRRNGRTFFIKMSYLFRKSFEKKG